MRIGDVAVFRLGTTTKSGIIQSINDKTIRVKIKDGNIIKRHLDKHVIKVFDDIENKNAEFANTPIS